jgi:D-alanine-D-alanine ligase
MKVALIYSSKKGMETAWSRLYAGAPASFPGDWLAECDAEDTIDAVRRTLEERHRVIPLEADEFVFERLRNDRPDLVFNIAEGLFGPSRESHIPAVCEMLNLPYTGSDPLTLGICLDKSRAKEILVYHRIPTPEFVVAEKPEEIPGDFALPAIVKPLFEGSSKGITDNSVVRETCSLRERASEVLMRYRQPVLIEKFLEGREFTVGGVGNPPHLEIFPIVEIRHDCLPAGANPIYSYEAKWIWDRPENPLEIFTCPADCPAGLEHRILDVVRDTWRVLRIRDWGRIDVRLDAAGRPSVIEVNPLPGILPDPKENSCLPKAARAAGYSYSGLIHRVVEAALERVAPVPRPPSRERRVNP